MLGGDGKLKIRGSGSRSFSSLVHPSFFAVDSPHNCNLDGLEVAEPVVAAAAAEMIRVEPELKGLGELTTGSSRMTNGSSRSTTTSETQTDTFLLSRVVALPLAEDSTKAGDEI